MKTQTAEQPKRQKKLQLKVDNLVHIHDHGLAVEFSDPQLVELVESFRKDGLYEIKAGLLWLKIQTIGRVTFTHLFRAHGSYHYKAVHYHDKSTGLKYSHKDSANDDAFLTLVSVMTGTGMPSIWRCQSGAGQDELRRWIKSYAWTLAGEAGLRAKAIEALRSRLASDVSGRKGQRDFTKREITTFNERDFDAEIEDRRKQVKYQLKLLSSKCDSVTAAEAAIASGKEFFSSHAYEVGAQYQSVWKNKDNAWKYTYKFAGSPPKTSHEIRNPNYTATRDGDRLTLSSGIVCPFSASQVIKWLTDGGTPPCCSYGYLARIECADPSGQPLVLVKCGCHYIDGRNLGEDFADALKPKHTVTMTDGVKELVLTDETREAFLERVRENVKKILAANQHAKEQHAANFFQNKRELLNFKNNKQQHLTEMQKRLEADEIQLQIAEKDLAENRIIKLSGNEKQMQENIILALNALGGIRA